MKAVHWAVALVASSVDSSVDRKVVTMAEAMVENSADKLVGRSAALKVGNWAVK